MQDGNFQITIGLFPSIGIVLVKGTGQSTCWRFFRGAKSTSASGKRYWTIKWLEIASVANWSVGSDGVLSLLLRTYWPIVLLEIFRCAVKSTLALRGAIRGAIVWREICLVCLETLRDRWRRSQRTGRSNRWRYWFRGAIRGQSVVLARELALRGYCFRGDLPWCR